MPVYRTIRRSAGRPIAIVIALALLMTPLATSQAQPDQSTVPGKRFAAYEYGWYPIDHVDHFNEALPTYWEPFGTDGEADVFTTRGMFAIRSGTTHSTGATLRGHARDRGRWEIRLKADRLETGASDFAAVASLVPAGRAAGRCGARDIAFASFRPTGSQARFYSRTLPNHAFTSVKRGMNLSNGYWHTYGVEVTPRRLAWFVDGRVQAIESRPAALSGIPLALRLELRAVPGRRMNATKLRVDTVRYFSLRSPNNRPLRAPGMTKGRYHGAC